MKKFIRTKCGTIWELGEDNLYHHPYYVTIVGGDENFVVKKGNKVTDLIMYDDLVEDPDAVHYIRSELMAKVFAKKATTIMARTPKGFEIKAKKKEGKWRLC